MKTVDVIIPAYNPDAKFRVLMRMLRRQSYPVHKIIIMNTGTALQNQDHYERHSRSQNVELEVHHLLPEEYDHGGTRNAGAGFSNADILVFMTQDAVPEDEYLIERLIKPLIISDKVAVSYARQLADNDCGVAETFTRSFNYPAESRVKSKEDLPELGIKTYFASNVCAAYSHDIYDQLGGFIRKTIFNEDMIFAGKAIQSGYQIAYTADARVIHSHNYSNMQQFHRNFDLAVSQKDHPEIFAGVPSEGEGIRLVKQTMKYLMEIHKPWLIPGLVIKSAFKYAGYLMGKNYNKLPMWLVKKCSMNRKYWS